MELRVKDICKEKGILFKDLAEKLGVTDVGLRKQVQGNPTIGTLSKIADALEVDITELFIPNAGKELTALVDFKGDLYKATTLSGLERIVSKIKGE